jgi:hypothetical protein
VIGEAFAFGDVEGLAAFMRVPGGAGTGGKWTCADVELGLVVGFDDAV